VNVHSHFATQVKILTAENEMVKFEKGLSCAKLLLLEKKIILHVVPQALITKNYHFNNAGSPPIFFIAKFSIG
jgi:hypothetical protein